MWRRFRGGLVFEAHRRLYHSTLGSRVIKKKASEPTAPRFATVYIYIYIYIYVYQHFNPWFSVVVHPPLSSKEGTTWPPPLHFYLTKGGHQVLLQKSIPAQIRRLILYISNNKGWVDEFVRKLPLENDFFRTAATTPRLSLRMSSFISFRKSNPPQKSSN